MGGFERPKRISVLKKFYKKEWCLKMKGYKINYIDEGGKKTCTFFGDPVSSPGCPIVDKLEIIMLMFSNAHPKCEVTSIRRCTLDEFEKYIKTLTK